MTSILLGSYLAILSGFFALFFSYLLKQSKDKRKLMFLIVFVYSVFICIPEMVPIFGNTQIPTNVYGWGPLPITAAFLFVALAGLLKCNDFSKPFKVFLFLTAISTTMIVLPIPVTPPPEILYPTMSVTAIFVSFYLVAKRREVPDCMFLLSATCFSLAGIGRGPMGLGMEFIVFAYTCAYIFLALVFVTARERMGSVVASFFTLERELKQTQEELESSRDQLIMAENNFKSLINAIADPVVIVDYKGHFLEINDRITEATGFTRKELIGKHFLKTDVVTDKSKTILVEKLSKRLKGIDVKPYDIEVKTKSGEVTNWEVKAKKIGYEGKTAEVVVFRDVTERKRTEEKLEKHAEQLEEKVKERTKTLKESEEKIKAILNAIPDLIWQISKDGVFLELIPTKDLPALIQPEQMLGKNIHDVAPKWFAQKVMQHAEKAVQTKEVQIFEYQLPFTSENGEMHDYEARLVVGDDGKILTIVRDITERKHMENELRRYSERLEELVEERTTALQESQERLVKSEKLAAIGQAATMVGHDLRNPLQAIENGVYYVNSELANVPTSPKLTETLQTIHRSVEYADNIVKDLQSFASKKEPVFRKTDINALVEETFAHVKTPENMKIVTDFGELPKLDVDKDMMKRIFVNLAVNGIQAMEKKGGTLKVSTRKTNGCVQVSFEDTGTGMKEETMKKIFTPFFTTKAQGMGVGLAICKRFVDIHGGNINVESEEGKGSVFTVNLPTDRNGGGKCD